MGLVIIVHQRQVAVRGEGGGGRLCRVGIALVLALLGGGGFFAYTKFFKGGGKKEQSKPDPDSVVMVVVLPSSLAAASVVSAAKAGTLDRLTPIAKASSRDSFLRRWTAPPPVPARPLTLFSRTAAISRWA